MNDASFTPLGIFPSLQDNSSTWSKSRLRVSSIPIICTPTAGSPWNGIVVESISCFISRLSVITSTDKSPDSVSDASRLITIYILKSDSCMSASDVSLLLIPAILMISMTHLSRQRFGCAPGEQYFLLLFMSQNKVFRLSSSERSLPSG